MREDLRVAARAERVAGVLQVLTDVDVVVELAVLDRPDRSALVRDRLMPALDVDDAESANTERNAVLQVYAAVVRASMRHDIGHDAEPLLGDHRSRRSRHLDDAADSAHDLTLDARVLGVDTRSRRRRRAGTGAVPRAGEAKALDMAHSRRGALGRERGMCELAERDPDPLEQRRNAVVVELRVPEPARHERGEQRRAWRRLPAHMHGTSAGLELDAVAGLPHPPAEIDVVAVEEEPLVPPPELLERRTPHEHAGSGDPVDRTGAGVRRRVSNHLVAPFCAREQPVEKQRSRIRGAEAGKSTDRVVDGAVLVGDDWGDEANVVIRLERGCEPMH